MLQVLCLCIIHMRLTLQLVICPKKFPEQRRVFFVLKSLTRTDHRRSPRVQGGLEIPLKVTAEMDLTENRLSF